jgi:hypothetical protein
MYIAYSTIVDLTIVYCIFITTVDLAIVDLTIV